MTPPKLSQLNEYYQTFRALNTARRQAFRIPESQLWRDKFVIFSDVHKGDGRNVSDDFRHNEDTYCYALSHYLDKGFRLILNGDIEECWKSSREAIFNRYRNTAFALEREFMRRGIGSYLRTYGNHDDDWADPRQVNKYLAPALGGPLEVYPAIQLGDHIIIAHGHQGDLTADRISRLSRQVVRRLWRPFQHLLGYQLDGQLAQNYVLSSSRERFLHQWAVLNKQLLIAGHTHRAIFHPNAPTNTDHYLNVGCCVHKDGITGLEIEGGEIRLISWQGTQVERHILASSPLAPLLARL